MHSTRSITLVVLFITVLLNFLVSALKHEDGVFTLDDLQKPSSRLYLSILGRIYDVTAGKRHYGPNGDYSHFAKRDATRAFATGDFSPAGLTDDINDLTGTHCLDILQWAKFFEEHTIYKFVGYLEGRFYGADGKSTSEMDKFRECVARGREEKQKEKEEKEKLQCTFDWRGAGAVACISGYVPREAQFMSEITNAQGGKEDKLTTSCVCIEREQAHSRKDLRIYGECDPGSSYCKLKDGEL